MAKKTEVASPVDRIAEARALLDAEAQERFAAFNTELSALCRRHRIRLDVDARIVLLPAEEGNGA